MITKVKIKTFQTPKTSVSSEGNVEETRSILVLYDDMGSLRCRITLAYDIADGTSEDSIRAILRLHGYSAGDFLNISVEGI